MFRKYKGFGGICNEEHWNAIKIWAKDLKLQRNPYVYDYIFGCWRMWIKIGSLAADNGINPLKFIETAQKLSLLKLELLLKKYVIEGGMGIGEFFDMISKMTAEEFFDLPLEADKEEFLNSNEFKKI